LEEINNLENLIREQEPGKEEPEPLEEDDEEHLMNSTKESDEDEIDDLEDYVINPEGDSLNPVDMMQDVLYFIPLYIIERVYKSNPEAMEQDDKTFMDAVLDTYFKQPMKNRDFLKKGDGINEPMSYIKWRKKTIGQGQLLGVMQKFMKEYQEINGFKIMDKNVIDNLLSELSNEESVKRARDKKDEVLEMSKAEEKQLQEEYLKKARFDRRLLAGKIYHHMEDVARQIYELHPKRILNSDFDAAIKSYFPDIDRVNLVNLYDAHTAACSIEQIGGKEITWNNLRTIYRSLHERKRGGSIRQRLVKAGAGKAIGSKVKFPDKPDGIDGKYSPHELLLLLPEGYAKAISHTMISVAAANPGIDFEKNIKNLSQLYRTGSKKPRFKSASASYGLESNMKHSSDGIESWI
jgi:hypothetical protein